MSARPFLVRERIVKLADAARDFGGVELDHRRAGLPGLGARDHQQRVEGADQLVGFLDRAFQRRAIVGFALARAQRLLGAISKPRQRRLEIVGDVVGNLLEAPHQRLDPLQHDVEIDREPVELVVGTGSRQTAGEVAGHDGARRLGHGVNAAQHAARDEEAAGQPQDDDQRDRPLPSGENDVVEPLPLLEIAADQQAKSARQLEHAHQRVMLGAFGIVEAAIDRFGPAGMLEHALAEQADIAGEPVAAERRRGDRGSIPADARVHR